MRRRDDAKLKLETEKSIGIILYAAREITESLEGQ
jgi:hypothetical protein